MSAPAIPGFIHLRVHTEYSLVDGLIDVKALVKRTANLGMPAVAVTDHNNLFAIVKFYKSAQSAGIKPIAGADVLITQPEELQNPYPMTLFVQDAQGYRTLSRLLSKAFRENQHQGQPQIRAEWLEEENQGLIALSGPRQGQIARQVLAGNHEGQHLIRPW